MSDPLSALSPSKQNIRLSPSSKPERQKPSHEFALTESGLMATTMVSNNPPPLQRALALTPQGNTLDEPDPLVNASSLDESILLEVASADKLRSPSIIPLSDNTKRDLAPMPSSPSESTLRFNEGFTHALDDGREDLQSADRVSHQDDGDEGMSTIMHGPKGAEKTETTMEEDETEITLTIDDTVGDLSTLSAVPNADMTLFASLRSASPTKMEGSRDWTPQNAKRGSIIGTPGTIPRRLHLGSRQGEGADEDPDITPRRPYSADSPADLLNFTGQSNVFIPPPGSAPRTAPRRSMSGRGSFPVRVHPSPSHRSQASIDRERSRGSFSPIRHPYMAPSIPVTPAESRNRYNNVGDLLDFDLEPMPTPRSIPSITPRELETLRSDMQSQISGLSATLSGKEAEVMALKRAITDAEVRVGNTSEELRNERGARDGLEEEKREWDRRRREMENVLREVKQEILIGERERDKLRMQVEDTDKRAEEQEVRILELEAMLESSKRQNNSSPAKNGDGPVTPGASMDIECAVKDATERVARELHSLYKGKHETKVAALKNSYQARWEKKVRGLEANLQSAKEEIAELKAERDDALAGVVPRQEEQEHNTEELVAEMEQIKAEKRMLHARITDLEEEKKTTQNECETLRADLERERMEKGELVAQVDLFLAMDAEMKFSTSSFVRGPAAFAMEEKTVAAASKDLLPTSPSASATSDRFRSSIHGSGGARPGFSMLKQPAKSFTGIPGPGGAGGGAGDSRIGRAPLVGRGLASSHHRSGGGSGIMEGITRMGMGAGGAGGGAR